MREIAFSSAAWEKLVNDLVTTDASSHVLPGGSVRLQVWKLMWSVPKNRIKTWAAAPPSTAWAESWSGMGGVGTNGVQVGSAAVSGLPSVSAVWMAVTGRQIVVEVLRLERADVSVCEGHVEQAEQARVLPEVEAGIAGDGPGDPVPLQWGALDPEERDLRLVVRALAGRCDAVASETLYFLEVRGVPPGGYGERSIRTELRAVPQHERRDVRPSRSERERRSRREAVLAGFVPCG